MTELLTSVVIGGRSWRWDEACGDLGDVAVVVRRPCLVNNSCFGSHRKPHMTNESFEVRRTQRDMIDRHALTVIENHT